MRARINRKLYEIYGMDIESHNDEESIAKRETSMWLGCFINEDSKENDEDSYFYTMDEFLERCEKIVSLERRFFICFETLLFFFLFSCNYL